MTRKRTRQAVFLIGGKGTRLGELAKDTPKPLLPLNDGRPFLDLLIETAIRQGFDDIVLLAGHLGEVVSETYANRLILGRSVKVLIEPVPMGTGGALNFAMDHLNETFLLANGDTFFDINYRALEPLLYEHGDIKGVMALRHVESTARYGAVTIVDGLVTAFEEKTGLDEPGLINAGAYLLRKSAFVNAPKGAFSIEADLLPTLATSAQMAAFPADGFFIDIGLPETLAAAREALVVSRPRPGLFLDRDGVLNIDHGYVHKPADFDWVPGAKAAIRAANDAGWLVFVVTNQAGIARGYYSEADMHALHAWVQDELALAGAYIDQFYHCPYHPDGVVPEFTGNHPDRKPQPGMILRALADWPVDPTRSFLIGDRETDLQAAAAGGIAADLFTGDNLSGFVVPRIER